jgi:hypothetical protein
MQKFSNVLSKLPLCSKHTRTLTFENFCQAFLAEKRRRAGMVKCVYMRARGGVFVCVCARVRTCVNVCV